MENVHICLSIRIVIPRTSKCFARALLFKFDVSFPNVQGHDDSEHRSGPALCERHTGQIAALESYCHGEHTQSIASLQSRSFGPILQGKLTVEDGVNVRRLSLLHGLSNAVHMSAVTPCGSTVILVQSQNIQQDIDYMDLGARQENLHARGEPIMLQLCIVPAYSLTVRRPHC